MPPLMKLTAITLDCPAPAALAAFYQRATGWEQAAGSDDEFAAVTGGGIFLCFQRVADYRAPRWPDQDVPQQIHLDFAVEDLDETESRLLRLGAHKPRQHQEQGRWRVLADPAGHPFCLTRG